jgi:hypothetical protein
MASQSLPAISAGDLAVVSLLGAGMLASASTERGKFGAF